MLTDMMERLVEWERANPGGSNADAAKALGVSEAWVGLVRDSELWDCQVKGLSLG